MATTAKGRAPVHLWIVGILSLLWGCMGAYDYMMTRMHNVAYFQKAMPGVDPNIALAWLDGMPMYAQIGWGLGVWGGLLGAVLLLIRSRYALWAYAASMIGMVLCFGYQLGLAPALPGADSAMYKITPLLIMAFGLFLLWYSWAMEKRGVLR